jgi:hypothetical protein
VRLLASIDWMKVAVWISVSGSLLTIVGAGIISRQASASRNLVLACATVISALLFGLLQGWIELRAPTRRDGIGGSFQLDPKGPSIRHVRKKASGQEISAGLIESSRLFPEDRAASVLASMKPKVDFTAGDNASILQRIKIATDFYP